MEQSINKLQKNQTKKILTKHNEIWLDDEGILRVRSVEGTELDLEEVKECFEIYRKLGVDKEKCLQLLIPSGHLILTKDAREYSAQQGKHFFKAVAIISNSLIVRMLFNFFNSFYNHGVPFRLFANEEEALKWLRKYKDA